ncbi:MAG: prepilin peptidase [Hyphomicrobiales bacterium]|nr:prepilin peptidase [Hyphomicrobiales bacterium]
MNETLQLAFAAIFVLSVVYAIITDISSLRIPNIVSIILVLAFVPFMLLGGVQTIWPHFAVAAAVFLILFLSFAMGWLGAGDVKFASAIALWAGPVHGPPFLVAFAILGGLFAVLLLLLRSAQNVYPIISTYPVLDKLSGWARNKIMPYGVPLGIAALLVAPAIFGMR